PYYCRRVMSLRCLNENRKRSVRQRHAGDNDEIGRFDEPVILRLVTDCHLAKLLAHHVRAHVRRRDLEPPIDERTYYAGGRPTYEDAPFASLNCIKALPPQYKVGFINKQSRPECIFIA